MSLIGTAIILGTLARGGAESFYEGCDLLGAEVPATHTEPLLDPRQYWTSVAAGLTVAGILAIGGAILYSKKGRR